jgi:hypothetical protein
MQPRKIITSSLVVLSLATLNLYGSSTAVHAFGGKCGDSPYPCEESEQRNSEPVRIYYSIKNLTQQTVKFALPTGKIYQLNPGQRGYYKNTGSPENLRIYVFDESRFYNLVSGNYQFKQNSEGKIKFYRMN